MKQVKEGPGKHEIERNGQDWEKIKLRRELAAEYDARAKAIKGEHLPKDELVAKLTELRKEREEKVLAIGK